MRTLGHELGGVVASVGEKVTRVGLGDHVAIAPGETHCTHCRNCQNNHPNLCSNYGPNNYMGIGRDGGWTKYVEVTEDEVFPLPDDFPYPLVSLCEPYSTILNGYRRLGII